MTFFRILAGPLAALAIGFAGSPATAAIAPAEAAARNPSADLRERHAQVRERLEKSPYGRPLWLDSREMARQLQGDAYAIVSHPYAKVEAALVPVGNWCDLLMLPFNTKNCESTTAEGGRLSLFVGRKNDTPVERTYRLDFQYELAARTRDYMQLVLKCENGPLGTRDYRIVLEATPIDENRTFLHLSYTYGYGTLSKVAMQAYLATVGASKVGFTTERAADGGQPQLVSGMRGVMERNTMRYALAIEAYLASLDGPRDARLAKRLNEWFSATERYPRQLREEDVDRAQYLAMKRREFARMAGAGPTTATGS
ncbi:MAG: hypothetical protein M3R58_00465 [Pseudomonadota bacterium]|nr:hypothetical protein [Pseudomonadota bacterium]